MKMKAKRQLINQVIFWGATGQAKVLRECLQGTGYELVALFDNDEQAASPFKSVPLYHGVKEFEGWMRKRGVSDPPGFLVAIGGDRGKDRLDRKSVV